ncbi:MAG: Rdx family protein [Candidatus Obscuribacterales bacterium]|nr:Rdx family protein [Candidatus Obscuribacterales bacterium]
MADELKSAFSADCDLIKSSGGVFEIESNGSLIFSKASLGRFPEDGEIAELIRKKS